MKIRNVCCFLSALAALPVSPLRASFITGFETSDGGYTTNAQVNGVQDNDAPLGNTWHNVSGFSGGGNANSSNVLPKTGALSLRLLDSSTGSATAAAVDLGSSLDTTAPFTLEFSWAATAFSTTGVVSAWLGTEANSLSQKMWTHVTYTPDTGALGVFVSNAGGTSTQSVTVGNFSTIANPLEYMTWSIAINPVTHTYTSVVVSGSKGSLDVTSAVLAVNGGTIPWIPSVAGDPPKTLWFSTGGAGTITTYIDDIAAVPEPTSPLMILAGLGALVLAQRSSRRK